jgi:hypothetical protein
MRAENLTGAIQRTQGFGTHVRHPWHPCGTSCPRHDHETTLIGLLEHIDEAVSILADAKIKDTLQPISSPSGAATGHGRGRANSPGLASACMSLSGSASGPCKLPLILTGAGLCILSGRSPLRAKSPGRSPPDTSRGSFFWLWMGLAMMPASNGIGAGRLISGEQLSSLGSAGFGEPRSQTGALRFVAPKTASAAVAHPARLR